MANISEISGNIFDSSCQTIVNTVNCRGVMGRGIAFEFKHRFPSMFKKYAEACDQKKLSPGTLQLFKTTTPWVLNFPTKDDWKFPSKLEYIESGLKKFSDTFNKRNISSIAFPLLGTSNGGLKWDDVGPVMYRYLEPLNNLDVEIYHYDPKAKDDLFEKFCQKVNRFDVGDYQNYLNLTKKQASVVSEAIGSNKLKQMTDFEKLKGIGEKSFNNIFEFARSDEKILTNQDQNPTLF
jgi:O-acetyl-ADP-ribose deacetylase (regulator of RNase III)